MCAVQLVENRSARAIWWECPVCQGRSIGIALLRQSAQRGWVNELWGHAFESQVPGRYPCPSCTRPMSEATAGGLALDVCFGCQLVWFDTAEYDTAPLAKDERVEPLSQHALETMGRVDIEGILADYRRRFPARTSTGALPMITGLAGLPMEDEARELADDPWATWMLTAVLFILGFWSLFEPALGERFGLIATAVDRSGGAPFITSLFVHATAFQLATNLYFLFFFGDNVEDAMGRLVFTALFLAGGLAGNALHVSLDANDPALLMGASGSVCAVVVFYALRFPDRQLRYIRLFRWHTMPATAGLLFWVLAKVASTQAVLGRAEPSFWPYVGGAAVGLAFWRALRDNPGGRAKPVRNGS